MKAKQKNTLSQLELNARVSYKEHFKDLIQLKEQIELICNIEVFPKVEYDTDNTCINTIILDSNNIAVDYDELEPFLKERDINSIKDLFKEAMKEQNISLFKYYYENN